MKNIEKLASRLAITAASTTKRLSHNKLSKIFSNFINSRSYCRRMHDAPLSSSTGVVSAAQKVPVFTFAHADRPRAAATCMILGAGALRRPGRRRPQQFQTPPAQIGDGAARA